MNDHNNELDTKYKNLQDSLLKTNKTLENSSKSIETQITTKLNEFIEW